MLADKQRDQKMASISPRKQEGEGGRARERDQSQLRSVDILIRLFGKFKTYFVLALWS